MLLSPHQGACTARRRATTLDMLREVVPSAAMAAVAQADGAAAPSPGLLPKHYSPRTPLFLYEGEPADSLQRLVRDTMAAIAESQSVGIIAAEEDWYALEGLTAPNRSSVALRYLGSEHDLPAIASRLYTAFRELDSLGVSRIFVRAFPTEEGLGIAIQDRLRRAAAGRIVWR